MKSSRIILNIVNGALSILIMVLVAFVILRAGTIAYDLGYRIFTEPPLEEAPGRDKPVKIKKGMTALELGSLLEEKRLVDSGLLFAIQLQISDYSGKIKTGTHTLNTSQTAREMMQIMAEEEIEETEE